MIFLSQLLDSLIFNTLQEMIGQVSDLVVKNRFEKYPLLVGLLFKNQTGKIFIDYENIEYLSPTGIMLNRNRWENWEENTNTILLKRDLLDQQIFDVKGVRVVRVNDLQFIKIQNEFTLVSIDISTSALIRRMGIPFSIFSRFTKPQFIDWHNVDFVRNTVGNLKLKTPYEKLEKLHPADIANLIENLTINESSRVVQSLESDTAAEVLAEVEPDYKDTLLERIHPQKLTNILEEMPTDEAADVIQDLSAPKRDQVVRGLRATKKKVLAGLTDYEDDTAGGLMSTDYLAITTDTSIAQAITLIRKKSNEHRFIYHIFIINNNKKLCGIISIRTLLLANRRTKIGEVASPVTQTVSLTANYKEIARVLTKYNLLSVAVIDEAEKLVGIVTVDDVMRLLIPDA